MNAVRVQINTSLKYCFILFPCEGVYFSGWGVAIKDQASYWKAEEQQVSEKVEGNSIIQTEVNDLSHFLLPVSPQYIFISHTLEPVYSLKFSHFYLRNESNEDILAYLMMFRCAV